jgi:hypothetical protein
LQVGEIDARPDSIARGWALIAVLCNPGLNFHGLHRALKKTPDNASGFKKSPAITQGNHH